MTNRRRVLLAAISALGTTRSDSVSLLRTLTQSDARATNRERLLAAAGLGGIELSALLKHTPTYEQLVNALRAWGPRWQQLSSFATDSEVRATLRRWVAEDFPSGALTEIDGWQLAATEAALIALQADAYAA